MTTYLLPLPQQQLLISEFMKIGASLTRLKSCSLNRSITIREKTQLGAILRVLCHPSAGMQPCRCHRMLCTPQTQICFELGSFFA